MSKDAMPLRFVALCILPCCVFPVAIGMIAQAYAFDRLPRDDDYRSWPVYTIDALFWTDVFFTLALIASMRGWRILVAVLSVPLLFATGILAVTGGMWVEGTYF